MKIVMHGPLAGYGPDGTIMSWAPDQVVELDDRDKTAVAWGRGWVAMGATLLQDVAARETKAPAAAAQQRSSRP